MKRFEKEINSTEDFNDEINVFDDSDDDNLKQNYLVKYFWCIWSIKYIDLENESTKKNEKQSVHDWKKRTLSREETERKKN